MIRSPLFYVGDKYKLVPQLLKYFPTNINNYFEPFFGGGSSQLQVNAKHYYLNDIDTNIIGIHKMLLSFLDQPEKFYASLFYNIKKYNLSCSYLEDMIPVELKKKYPKTYYSKFNNENYLKLKNDFNYKKDDYLLLYILLIYGFNHMIRFNSSGEFNLPVGNVDLNKNVVEALKNYFELQKNRDIKLSSMDFELFLKSAKFKKNDFIYLDPPYLISMSEYNKLWNEKDEIRMYELLDKLNDNGVKFGLTNLLIHKDKKNNILEEWSKKYIVKEIKSNYISFNDNSVKENSIEIYVHN